MNNIIVIVKCPHCDQYIEIVEMNCRIFRCGIFKANGEQINPHMSKIDMEKLKNENLINGCGNQFQIDVNNNPVVCEGL